MRHLIGYFRSYFGATWSAGYVVSMLLLAGALVCARFGLHRLPASSVWVFAFSYWGSFALQYVFFRDLAHHRSPRWWAIVVGAPLLFTLHTSFAPGFARGDYYYALQYAGRSLVLILPPLLLAMAWRGTSPPAIFGLRRPDTWGYVPYLLLAMLPLLVYASVQPDFLQLYPRYKVVPHSALPIAAYELGYGLDLFSMEFFFRGLLVLALARVCKAHAILPAALLYGTAHFGKPLAECVSSFFGGVLLGVIAYESRSIWVGVLLHLCLAWGLEALAFRL